MASVLDGISKGKVMRPHLVLIYGPDGVGKTTFAAGAPAPLFLGSEEGTNNMDVARLPGLNTLDKIRQALAALANEKHSYKTIVLDSLDWLESLIFDEVVVQHDKKISGITDIGYNKGFAKALDKWKALLPFVAALRDKGMNFIAISHSKVKKFEDPSTPQGYERYQLKLYTGNDGDASALWREYVDTVLFANYVTYTSTDDKKRGFGDGARVMFTERRPGWDAKNRNGLPLQLPLSWDSYAEAMAKGEPENPFVLLGQIEGLKAQIKNKELVPKIDAAVEKAKGNAVKLAEVKNKLEAVLGTQG